VTSSSTPPVSSSVISATLKLLGEVSTSGQGRRVAFSPDGSTWAASASGAIWLGEGLRPTRVLRVPGVGGDLLRFSGDGRLLASPRAVELSSGALLETPELLAGSLNAELPLFIPVASVWDPEGVRVLAAVRYQPPRGRGTATHGRADLEGPPARLVLVDATSGELVATLWEAASQAPEAVAAEGRTLAAAALTVQLWDRQTLVARGELAGHRHTVRHLVLTPDGRLLASGAADGEVGLWDALAATRLALWPAHASEARGLALHPRLPLLATGGGDGRLRLWSLDSPPRLLADEAEPGPVDALAFSPDGGQLLVAARGDRPGVRLYGVAAEGRFVLP